LYTPVEPGRVKSNFHSRKQSFEFAWPLENGESVSPFLSFLSQDNNVSISLVPFFVRLIGLMRCVIDEQHPACLHDCYIVFSETPADEMNELFLQM
jgi:hypothetical protein